MKLPGAPFVAYRGERLFIDGCDATELARRFGTPLYVYSRGAMRAALEPYQRALAGRTHRIGYAMTANSTPARAKVCSTASVEFAFMA